MGFKRYLKRKSLRLYGKIIGEKASPAYIARGWAIGMFYGCLFPFGTQLFFSVPTSFILKGSKIGACLGTFITNHFTVFFIYPLQCYLGGKILGQSTGYSDVERALSQVVESGDWNTLMHLSGELFWAFFAGGLVFSIVAAPATYFFVKYLVESYRRGGKKRAENANPAERARD